MIFKRYGTTVESVEPNFESKALTEVSFRRSRERSIPVEEFETGYRRVSVHELEAAADGDVHDHVEQEMLDALEARLRALEDGLEDDEVLFVESGHDKDHPKTRSDEEKVIVEGENRLHFHVYVDPPLKVGVYRKET